MVSNFSSKGVEESKSSLQPCLLIRDRGNCGIQTNMFNNEPQLLYDVGGEIPEFLGRDIACCFGEWVLLTRLGTGNNLPEVLVNMLSKEIIELPLLGMKYDFSILTSHPNDPNCHIVYFSTEEKALIFCQPGDKAFTIKKWHYEFLPSGGRAFVAGKLFLDINEPSRFSVLGVIEFKESTFRFKVVKMDRGIRSTAWLNPSFFEYSGELFIVYRIRCGFFGRSPVSGFEIFKADFLNKKWVSVKSIGSLAIFIDYGNYGTAAHLQCASVDSGIKANSIYFLQVAYRDNYYIYNLEDGTIRMKPIFSSMEMETTKGTTLDWIMMPSEASFSRLLNGDQQSICHDSEKEASVEVEEVGVQNSWNMVPPELLNLIQLHLFGRDHAVFRAVCKAWQQVSIRDYSMPSIPGLLSSTTLLELCQSSSPLLMFQEDITISCDTVPIFRFFDPVHRKLYRTGIPELRETDIHYSRDGWLLVCRYSDESIFFFNPLTQEKIELPRVPVLDSCGPYYSLSFSSLPTCSNCLVVAMHRSVMLMFTLKYGEETWRLPGLGEFGRIEFVCCPVVLNGLHHFMSVNRDMLVFNFMDSVEGQFPYCQSWLSKFRRLQYEYFFLEIDGALAFVSIEPDGGETSIFKWNELETYWELMEAGDDFGGKEMFLSRRGSFLEKIDDGGGMGNTIFLPMIDHDAKEGVFYSLATQRYHRLYSGYSSELPYNVDQILNGIWVKPDRKIVGDSNLSWFM